MACLLHIEVVGAAGREEAAALLARTDESIRRFGGVPLLSTGAERIVRFDVPSRAAQCGLALRSRAAEHNRRAEPAARLRARVAAHAVRDKGLAQATRVGPADLELGRRLLEIVPPGRIFATSEAYRAWQDLRDCAFLPLGAEYFRGQPDPVDVFEVFPNPTLEL